MRARVEDEWVNANWPYNNIMACQTLVFVVS